MPLSVPENGCNGFRNSEDGPGVDPRGEHVVVLGIGNMLWADEGFGVRCVEALDAGWTFDGDIELVDGGTQGLYLTPYVNAARRLIILDAVDFGWAPGTVRAIEGEDVPAYLGAKKMSLHQTGFQEVLALAALTGPGPESLVLIGCQPADLSDFGGSLTAPVRAALPQALDLALERLRAWGIRAEPRRDARRADEALALPALEMAAYEAGRPSAEDACRIGDDRILALRAACMASAEVAAADVAREG